MTSRKEVKMKKGSYGTKRMNDGGLYRPRNMHGPYKTELWRVEVVKGRRREKKLW